MQDFPTPSTRLRCSSDVLATSLNTKGRNLVWVNPVVAEVVALRCDLAVTDSEEDGGSGDTCAPDCLSDLHAFGHSVQATGLLGTTAVELVADHSQCPLDQRKIGQGVRLLCEMGGLAEHPQDRRYLPLGKANLDVVHARTIRQHEGWNVVPPRTFEWR